MHAWQFGWNQARLAGCIVLRRSCVCVCVCVCVCAGREAVQKTYNAYMQHLKRKCTSTNKKDGEGTMSEQ